MKPDRSIQPSERGVSPPRVPYLSPAPHPEAPIGVFDSGVGGLTVVGALLRGLPNERVLYVADQAHVPYGGRPLEEVRGFATGISVFLAGQGCKAIVMACNISSAVALPCVRERLAPLPVFGVIEPAARRAALEGGDRIGVLATPGTVKSGAYTSQIHQMRPAASVKVVNEVACPDFVPLVEAGETESDAALAAAHRYLTPLADTGCRTIILGCTHYPFLLPVLRRAAAELFPHPVRFIDPADEMADVIARAVPQRSASSRASGGGQQLLTTGDLTAFGRQIPCFLRGIEATVGAVAWEHGGLELAHSVHRA